MMVKNINVEKYKKENPELFTQAAPQVPLYDNSDDATQSSTEQTLVDKKYKRALAGKMLLLARISDGDPTAILPDFRDNFLSILMESSKEILVRLYRSGVTDFAHERQQASRDYFTRMIRLGIWNNCTVNLWV